jgi:hypothetical protein
MDLGLDDIYSGGKGVSMNNNSVSVGTSTVAGLGTAALAFAGALLAYLTGDHTAQSVTAVELGGIAVLSGGITLLGRFAQAHKKITISHVVENVNKDLTPSNVNKSVEFLSQAIKNPSVTLETIAKDAPQIVSDAEEFASDPAAETRPESAVKPDSPIVEPAVVASTSQGNATTSTTLEG